MTTVAMIGLGSVVRHIHMPAFQALKDKVQVIAGCDPDSAARDHAAKKWGFQVFADAREMLAKTKPEVVAVCTPPWMHREHLALALEHGCHVFCEKPLADNLTDANEMVLAAEKAGRTVAINNQFPYMNIHLGAKKAIGSPEFGDLLYLHAWHTMRPTKETEAGWRGELARRLCFEFGVHVFELVRFFFEDDPVRLLAHMPNPRGKADCDVINVITLEFADGRGASILLDRLSRGPERYLDMRLDGESAIVHTSIGGEVRLQGGLHTKDRRPFVSFDFVKGGKAVLQRGSKSKVIAKDGLNPFGDAMVHHFSNFLRAIAEGGKPPGDIRDNLKTFALVMAAYDSAASGQWIDMKKYLDSPVGANSKA
jgi:predicted dehydrogenase